MLKKQQNGELKVLSNPKGTRDVYRSTDIMDNNIQPNLEIYPLPQSNLPAPRKHGSEELLVNGVFHGGEEWVPPGVFHGGEEEWVPPGVFHGGEEYVPPGVFHGGEDDFVPPFTIRRSSNCYELIPSGTFHNTINGAGLLSRFVSSVKQLFSNTPELPPSEIWYTTARGNYDFHFRFCWQKNYYEIDILKSPSYHPRSDGLHPTHRLPSNRGGYRICIKDNSKVNSLYQSKIYCSMWAEATARYIETGQTF